MDKTIIKRVKKILPRVLIMLGAIILIIAILFGAIKVNDYLQVNKLVKASDNLVKQEKYQEAYNDLTLTKARWTTQKIAKEVETKITLTKQLITDQSTYSQANDFFRQSKWQEAKDSYSKISDKFQHYKEAQDKIKECRTKIDEANDQAEQDKQTSARAEQTRQSRLKQNTASTQGSNDSQTTNQASVPAPANTSTPASAPTSPVCDQSVINGYEALKKEDEQLGESAIKSIQNIFNQTIANFQSRGEDTTAVVAEEQAKINQANLQTQANIYNVNLAELRYKASCQ